jgi:hypothetical protein
MRSLDNRILRRPSGPGEDGIREAAKNYVMTHDILLVKYY